ncbi:uncharacterized protein WM294_016059 isoform 1-T3 [Sarcoramphus papa]
MLCDSSWEREVRIYERNNSADTKVSEKGGEGGAPDTGTEIPLQPMVKTIVRQAVPLQPMEVNGGADIHPAAHGGPHDGAGGCALKEAVTQWRAHAGAGSWQELQPCGEEPTQEQIFRQDLIFWQDLCPCGEPTLEQSIPEGLCPVKRTHAGAVREEVQPVGRTHIGEVREGLSPVGRIPRWSRGRA